MTRTIDLEVGSVYFHVGFADNEFSIPIINTWTYDGFTEKDGHTFINIEESERYCFPKGIYGNILTRKLLVEWLQKDHSPKQIGEDYEYRCI